MKTSSLSSLDSLTDLRLRGGVDMRPTLLRVLTDLYVQKLTHTADEECHYTELALRLLEAVDVPTRTAVAVRLARHLAPPPQVVKRLAADLPEVAAPLRSARPLQQPNAMAVPAQQASFMPPVETAAAELRREAQQDSNPKTRDAAENVSSAIGAHVANELNELFFTASARVRRLILLNLDIVAPLTGGRAIVSREPALVHALEAAALARKREDFVQYLTRSLHISREQALRIARDELGEPVVVVAKALSMPRDVLYRILLFVNTAVGHSVERVHALAELFDEINARAAEDLVAIWQALDKDKQPAARHRPPPWREDKGPRPAAAIQRPPARSSRDGQRRDAS
jgi:hypothetical protein